MILPQKPLQLSNIHCIFAAETINNDDYGNIHYYIE